MCINPQNKYPAIKHKRKTQADSNQCVLFIILSFFMLISCCRLMYLLLSVNNSPSSDKYPHSDSVLQLQVLSPSPHLLKFSAIITDLKNYHSLALLCNPQLQAVRKFAGDPAPAYIPRQTVKGIEIRPPLGTLHNRAA